MKKFLVLVLTMSFVMSTSVHAQSNRFSTLFDSTGSAPSFQAKNPIASLGPFAVGAAFCQKLQALAPILQAYSTVMWPVIGIPGITTGIVQNESVLFKICDFLTQLQQLDTVGAVFHSARFLNELTGNKWDNHFNQADLLWNTSNLIYDLRGNGGFRKGALRSAYVHKRLIDAADQTAKYWQRENGDEDPEGLESRQERRQKLQRVAQLSYNRAVLTEAASCPEPKGNKNFQKEYTDKVVPEAANIKRREQRIRFFQEQIMKMGADMIADVGELEAYKQNVLALPTKGFGYKRQIAKTYIEREAPTGKLKAKQGSGPGLPEAEFKDKREPVEYQKIRVIQNVQMWNEFRQKYVKKWDRYVSGQLLTSGTYGLFDGKKGRIEEKYRSYAFECSEMQLALALPFKDRNDPRYWPELKKAQKKCRDNLKVRDAEYKNLMDRYIIFMQQDLRSAKQSQAKIWTFESLYLGVNPIIEDNPNSVNTTKKENERIAKGAQRPQEECRPQFTPGEMEKVNIELQNVNNALMEEVVRSGTEREVQRDLAREQEAKASEKMRKMQKQTDQKQKNNEESQNSRGVNINVNTRKAI